MRPLTEFLKTQTFIAFDTETTGLWAPANRIVELAAVKFQLDRQRHQTFQSLICPQRSIPDEVIRIHGITDEMVKDAPTAKPVLEQFVEFCGDDSILIAHNAPFDISFVGHELEQAGLEFGHNLIIDTVDLCRRLFRGLRSYSLQALVREFRLGHTQEHRALADAVLVWRVFRYAVKRLGPIESGEQLATMLATYHMQDWRPEPVHLPSRFTDLAQAIEKNRRVRMRYHKPTESSSWRVIHPKGTYALGSRIYVNAYCEQAQAERTFRLDRIADFEVLHD